MRNFTEFKNKPKPTSCFWLRNNWNSKNNQVWPAIKRSILDPIFRQCLLVIKEILILLKLRQPQWSEKSHEQLQFFIKKTFQHFWSFNITYLCCDYVKKNTLNEKIYRMSHQYWDNLISIVGQNLGGPIGPWVPTPLYSINITGTPEWILFGGAL